MRFRWLYGALALLAAALLATFPAHEGFAAKEILVGGIFDTSGPTSDVGKEYAQGCIDAADYINKHGGVRGIKVKLIPNDYGYKIPKAIPLYNKYKAMGIQIIQGWGTGDTNALKKFIQKDKIIYMSGSYDARLSNPKKTPYNFFAGTTYSDSIRMAMKFAKEQGAKKVVFIYPDHPYGKAPIPAGKDMAKRLGLKVGPDQFVPLNAKDATSQLLSMKKFDPDWAWIGGTTASTAVIIKDAVKLGIRTKFIINVWGFDENLPKLAGSAANDRAYGVCPFAMWGDDVPGMEPIVEMHKKKHPHDTHTVRYVQGWTSMMVMWEGLKKAKEFTGPAIKDALNTLRNFDTGGLCAPITFTPEDHRPNTELYIYKISNGKMVRIKKMSIERSKEFLGW